MSAPACPRCGVPRERYLVRVGRSLIATDYAPCAICCRLGLRTDAELPREQPAPPSLPHRKEPRR